MESRIARQLSMGFGAGIEKQTHGTERKDAKWSHALARKSF